MRPHLPFCFAFDSPACSRRNQMDVTSVRPTNLLKCAPSSVRSYQSSLLPHVVTTRYSIQCLRPFIVFTLGGEMSCTSVPNLIAIQINRRIDPKNDRSTGLQTHWPIDRPFLSLDPIDRLISRIDRSISLTKLDLATVWRCG